MKLINKNELSDRFHEIVSFLKSYDEKWLRFYFKDENELLNLLLEDEDIRMLVKRNEKNEIRTLVILNENAVMTAVFSEETENERSYSDALRAIDTLVKDLGYLCIYYGEGYYSYGVYSKDRKNPFGEFLKQNGFAVESVCYDILYKETNRTEEHVDQLKAQKITADFEICGRYETLCNQR